MFFGFLKGHIWKDNCNFIFYFLDAVYVENRLVMSDQLWAYTSNSTPLWQVVQHSSI